MKQQRQHSVIFMSNSMMLLTYPVRCVPACLSFDAGFFADEKLEL